MDEEAEVEEKRWTLEKMLRSIDSGIEVLEREKEEHQDLAEKCLDWIKELRNNCVAGLGFVLSTVLALAALQILTSYVIELVFALGATGLAVYVIFNLVHVRAAKYLVSVLGAYYAGLTIMRISRGEMIALSVLARTLSSERVTALFVVSGLIGGTTAKFISDGYRKAAVSGLGPAHMSEHMKVKSVQFGFDFNSVKDLYEKSKGLIENCNDFLPPQTQGIPKNTRRNPESRCSKIAIPLQSYRHGP